MILISALDIKHLENIQEYSMCFNELALYFLYFLTKCMLYFFAREIEITFYSH